MSEHLFVDTSGWYAFLNADDPLHGEVKVLMAQEGVRLVTSSYVFDELVTLVQARIGHRQAVSVGETLRNAAGLEVVPVSEKEETSAWQLFVKRGGSGYSFTDCTSFVLMRELGVRQAVTLDQHFRKEGFEVPALDK